MSAPETPLAFFTRALDQSVAFKWGAFVAKSGGTPDEQAMRLFQFFLLDANVPLPAIETKELKALFRLVKRFKDATPFLSTLRALRTDIDGYLTDPSFTQVTFFGCLGQIILQLRLLPVRRIWHAIEEANLQEATGAEAAKQIEAIVKQFWDEDLGKLAAPLKEPLAKFQDLMTRTKPPVTPVDFLELFAEIQNHSVLNGVPLSLPAFRESDKALIADFQRVIRLAANTDVSFETQQQLFRQIDAQIRKTSIDPIGNKQLAAVLAQRGKLERKAKKAAKLAAEKLAKKPLESPLLKKEEKKESKEDAKKEEEEEDIEKETEPKEEAKKEEAKKESKADAKAEEVLKGKKYHTDGDKGKKPAPKKSGSVQEKEEEEEDELDVTSFKLDDSVPESIEISLSGVKQRAKYTEVRRRLQECVLKLLASWDIVASNFPSDLMFITKEDSLDAKFRMITDPQALGNVFDYLMREFFREYMQAYLV